jgi:predicted dehydrogenase/threonine dehydrogenase-like Zn-dependent dehydrogenase
VKQVLQDLKSGRTVVAEVPAPKVRAGCLRIATSVSLVSAGTERMLVEFARGSLVSKARQQPERVKEAIQKVATDGLVSTVQAIRSKLDQPMLLGYCNVGQVLEVGAGVKGFRVGDRVVSNGSHAEVVVAPQNLAARVPDEVASEHAAFTVLGAIALQGARLAEPTLGESFVVVGLGLIGLMAVQILRANGCRVLGLDLDPERLALARKLGAETVAPGVDPVEAALAFSRGRGADGVLLTLSTSDSKPVSQAARMCRKRGRIVLVGVTGLEINRADFYEKELSFQVSCSYGPGRYDPAYEEKGQDYPVGFVRWTEQRNFEAVLDLMASGRLDVAPLITHRFGIEDAPTAYDVLSSGEKSIGILIEYPKREPQAAIGEAAETVRLRAPAPARAGAVRMGFIGAGAYSSRTLVQAFKQAGAELRTIVSAGGVSATHYGRKFGFDQAAADAEAILADPEIDAVCIATRHDSHAAYVKVALAAGKHVFVEKPLCLTLKELAAIEAAQAASGRLLMVGFNRRFAPMVVKAKARLAATPGPKSFVMMVNAGYVPAEHWAQDPAAGGGRLLGEGCHFIDLLRHLAGAPVTDFDVASLTAPGGPPRPDTAVIRLSFADGSIGVINYFANGAKAFPKERLEVFAAGRILAIDNYRRLLGYGVPSFRTVRALTQDKGQAGCARAFLQAIRTGSDAPIPLDEIIEVSRLSIAVADRAD